MNDLNRLRTLAGLKPLVESTKLVDTKKFTTYIVETEQTMVQPMQLEVGMRFLTPGPGRGQQGSPYIINAIGQQGIRCTSEEGKTRRFRIGADLIVYPDTVGQYDSFYKDNGDGSWSNYDHGKSVYGQLGPNGSFEPYKRY